MPVSDYLRRDPQTAGPDETLREAAQRMVEAGVGCLVIVDEERRPLGVVTDRDIALNVLRRKLDAEATPVIQLVDDSPVVVTEEASVAATIRILRTRGLRRVPVVHPETGELRGVLAVDDVLQLLSAELAAVAEVVRQQFPADLSGTHALPGGAS